MTRYKGNLRARMQGNLDGLCGVYSVVNSAMHIVPKRLSQGNTRELFRHLCVVLGEEGKLEDALIDGMTVQTLGKLIDAASQFLAMEKVGAIKRRLAFRTAPDGLDMFWTCLEEHIDKHGEGSVILGLSGKHDHWTCVGKISKTHVSLIDSDGLKRILRKNCTISDSYGSRHHVLWPTQTYLLEAA